MKRTINFPSIKVEEHQSVVLSGDSVYMYHLYVDGNFYRAFSSKDDLIEFLQTFMKVNLGVY